MHVDRDRMSAKFWLDPDVALATNWGFNRKELREIEQILHENLEPLRHEWDAFCNDNLD
ncbi:MAG: hypothetical protein FOGNACKC_02794 [Anaerolineae bacterium]|nr:hypothetical protein [Anaerolineae bacterium]